MAANVGRGIGVSRGPTFVALVLLAVGLVTLITPRGAEAGTLDQSQTIVGEPDDLSRVGYAGQTFTAGLSGGLDQVDVYIRRNPACTGASELAVEMYPGTNSTFPQGTVAPARALVPADSVPTSFDWVSFVFPRPATVSAGGKSTFLLRPMGATVCDPDQFPFYWAHAPRTEDPYPGGFGFYCAFACSGAGDYAFKTYVGPPPPPPPPPPEFTRYLTLRYSRNLGIFRGELGSDSGPRVCAPTVVRVFKVQKGPNPTVGSAIVNLVHRFKLEVRHAAGRYYATVDDGSGNGYTCLAARSKTIKVG